MAEGIVARGLKKVRRMLAEHAPAGKVSERQLSQIRDQLKECAVGLGGEVSVRQRAARLAETYLNLGDEGRAAFLRIVATEFGPDPKAVEKAHAQYQAAIGSDGQWAAESALRGAMTTWPNSMPRAVSTMTPSSSLSSIVAGSK